MILKKKKKKDFKLKDLEYMERHHLKEILMEDTVQTKYKLAEKVEVNLWTSLHCLQTLKNLQAKKKDSTNLQEGMPVSV